MSAMSCARSAGSAAPSLGRVDRDSRSQVEQHVQHAGLSEPLDRDGGHHALQLFFDLVGRGCGLVLVDRAECGSTRRSRRGSGSRRSSVGDSVSPVAALSRLRSSTAVSESKPWSENARSGGDGLRRRQPEDGRHVRAHQLEQHRVLIVGRQSGQPGGQGRARLRGGQRVADLTTSGARDQVDEHRWQGARGRLGPQRGPVDARGNEERFVDDERLVEQCSARRRRASRGCRLD